MILPIHRLLLGIQRALLDAVTPSLRAVTVDINIEEEKQILTFFYDGKVTDELFDLASVAATEASCSLEFFTEEHVLQLDFPKLIPILGRLAFLRNEPILPKYTLHKNILYLKEMLPKGVLMLDIQQALLGKISSTLRAVQVGIDERKMVLSFYFFYDGSIIEKDHNLAKSAILEASVSFLNFKIDAHILRMDCPEKIPMKGQRYAYSRKEG